jgi:exopolyphosphatase/guanosine-5'-triphosphate,3'-diphosphate pyrophosphatase
MGFSWNEQRLLACLVGSHRRKINMESVAMLPARWQEQAVYMIVILRIAILINRDRIPKELPDIKTQGDDGALKIQFDEKWLEEHPLTGAELEQEQSYLKVLKIKVNIK